MASIDYYEVLGVGRDVSAAELKKAYRALAMKYHPDKNPGDKEAEQKFRDCNIAYQVLSDPEKKAQYDRYGKTFDGNGAGGFDFNSSFFDDVFGDAFGTMFGGGGRRHSSAADAPRRGSDIGYSKTISFEESIFGVDLTLNINKQKVCNSCHGTGAEPNGTQSCPTCHGSGMHTSKMGFFAVQTTCPTCGGLGKIIKEKCKDCHGDGFIAQEKRAIVKVPAGIEGGMSIRVAGEGNDGANGGPAGDLIVEIMVKPHKYYKRYKNDLVLELPISFTDAILGKNITIPMLDGKDEKIEIKAGTQMGDTITLRGKGAPDVRGRSTGNLVISLNIMLPTKLTAEQKKAVEHLAFISNEDMYKKPLWQKMKELFK
ncbi:molecular chaperone DnaJ [Deferribacterales bacterium RsTz2092]|nr:chaperone protein DnaJ [Deferribacterales bacterium]